MDETWLDGNELAGAMRELFAVDVTMARGQCASCGRTGTLAETRVYAMAPGLVVRCIDCEEVLLRFVRGPDRAWLDMRGVGYLEFGLPAEPVPTVGP